MNRAERRRVGRAEGRFLERSKPLEAGQILRERGVAPGGEREALEKFLGEFEGAVGETALTLGREVLENRLEELGWNRGKFERRLRGLD